MLQAIEHFDAKGFGGSAMTFFTWRCLTVGILALTAVACTATNVAAMQRHVVLCNKSNINFEVAVAYDKAGTREITSEGWFKVRSCACETLFNADVRATEFFYYVTKEGSAVNAALSSGKAPICVRGESFTFRSQNKNKAACSNAKGTWVNFAFGNAEKAKHTVNFRVGNSVCQ
jgi:uncharacterized membrane protein